MTKYLALLFLLLATVFAFVIPKTEAELDRLRAHGLDHRKITYYLRREGAPSYYFTTPSSNINRAIRNNDKESDYPQTPYRSHHAAAKRPDSPQRHGHGAGRLGSALESAARVMSIQSSKLEEQSFEIQKDSKLAARERALRIA